MSQQETKVPFREKLAYGCGDFASCLYWRTFMVYLPIFYTDVFGISAAALGTMLLFSRIWDGINDPIIGTLADRTESRFGKFRPYIIYGCVPFAIFGVLTFTTPNFEVSGKLIWAYITYNGLMMLYTTVNIPYTAMLGVMTTTAAERTKLSSMKFVFAFGAGIVVSATCLPLVDFLGAGNAQRGWQLAFVVYGLIAIGFFLITGFFTKERIKPSHVDVVNLGLEIRCFLTSRKAVVLVGLALGVTLFYNWFTERSVVSALWWQAMGATVALLTIYRLVIPVLRNRGVYVVDVEKSSIARDMNIISKNHAWLLLTATTLTWILFVGLRSSVSAHYFKYYIYNGSPDSPLNFLGYNFTLTGLLSAFNTVGQTASVAGVLLTSFLSARFAKRPLFLALFVLSILCTASYYFLPAGELGAIFAIEVLGNLAGAPLPVLLWAMYADTADYGEWQSGRRTTALVFSASLMSQKIGWALAAFFALQLMDFSGFVANVAPSLAVKNSIVQLMSIFPAALGIVSIVIFLFYPLTDKYVAEINEELKARREKLGLAPA